MKPLTNRIYIARKYWRHDFGPQSFYEESVFTTYELAYQFIQDISEEDNQRFLSEVVSYVLNKNESWEDMQVWIFNNKGKLLKFYDAQQEQKDEIVLQEYNDGCKLIGSEPIPESYTSKYEIGNIVLLKGYPDNLNSPISDDTLGVIVQSPMLYDEWIKQGNNKYEWDSEYVIYIIRDGYLYHLHVVEEELTLYQEEIPERFEFLVVFSKHITGEKTIKEEIFEKIVNGKIFVENVEYFNPDTSFE